MLCVGDIANIAGAWTIASSSSHSLYKLSSRPYSLTSHSSLAQRPASLASTGVLCVGRHMPRCGIHTSARQSA